MLVNGINQVTLNGEIIAKEEMRYTPAGVARMALTLQHRSQQNEAEYARQINCTIQTFAFGQIAQQAAQFAIGQKVKIQGFLAQQNLRSRQLVVHINQIILE